MEKAGPIPIPPGTPTTHQLGAKDKETPKNDPGAKKQVAPGDLSSLKKVNPPMFNPEGTLLSREDLIEELGEILSEVFLPGANLKGADLSGLNLSGADLSGANLTEANLTGANLTGANLTGADLTGANLTNAVLRRTNLTGVDLSNANLTRADLREAVLRRTNLRGADLTNANLSEIILLVGVSWGGARLFPRMVQEI